MRRRRLWFQALVVAALGTAVLFTEPKPANAMELCFTCVYGNYGDMCTYGGDYTCAVTCPFYNGNHMCVINDLYCDEYTLVCGSDPE